MSQQTRTYRERSREYLAKAFRELEAGDLPQASEKGWGAAAQMVKAVSGERGLEHRHHAVLIRLTHDLVRETGDPELQDLFDSANALHGNSYEDVLVHEEVERRLNRVAVFVDRVERLLPDIA